MSSSPSSYRDILDALVVEAEARLKVKATRDPSVVASLVAAEGGCVFVQFPAHIKRLLAGPNLEVPVSLVAAAPADLTSVNWLLDHYDDLVRVFGARTVNSGPLDIGTDTFPAVTVAAQIALNTSEVTP